MKSLIAAIIITVLLSVTMAPKPVERTAQAKSINKVVQTHVQAPEAVKTAPAVETPTPPDPPAVEPVKAPSEPVVVAPPVNAGSHEDWMAAAGISPGDYGAVNFIVSHESGWDPTNYYGKAQGLPYIEASSAAGLPQALPYSKTGCAWGDAVCQLIWANGYAVNRYGGWAGAYSYWVAHSNW